MRQGWLGQPRPINSHLPRTSLPCSDLSSNSHQAAVPPNLQPQSSQIEIAVTGALHLLYYLIFLGHYLLLHHVIHGLGDSATKTLKNASYSDGRDGQRALRWSSGDCRTWVWWTGGRGSVVKGLARPGSLFYRGANRSNFEP